MEQQLLTPVVLVVTFCPFSSSLFSDAPNFPSALEQQYPSNKSASSFPASLLWLVHKNLDSYIQRRMNGLPESPDTVLLLALCYVCLTIKIKEALVFDVQIKSSWRL